ncbi:MAG TPA: lysyl oxidase family protein [Candidatus Thermoplasmatota archaeon]|nr:lysyl oxidase family protein [Candidatus Thermoplasmatota archaeon]
MRWDGTQVADLGLDVSLAGASKEGARGFDARRVTWFSPPPGRVDVLLEGTGAFQAEAFLRSRLPAPDAPRLPDLTTTVPVDMHVGGCHEVERVEQGARKCLRLGNGVSNPGHGPLQVFLDVVSGVQALVLEGRFVQEVLQADGSWSRHPVGPAAFHAAHAHWHYDGLAAFSLHPVGADGLRGEAVAAHHKAGFCFLDWDRMPEDETQAGQGGNAEADCLVPGVQGWSNGVSAGWYDFYGSYLADQYVDIAGVPDGLYELVSVADPAGGLLERDRTNNAASVLLRLVGDRVSVLEERGWYRVQPEDA